MEFLYSQIKKMDVVSLNDGKNMGRVNDIAFYFPEGKIKGFFVTGCKGFKWGKSDEFIPISCVVKIGEDVILVRTGEEKPPRPQPPQHCPPNGNPNCPPNGRPPFPPQQGGYPPPPDPRRNFDDYE